MMILTKEIIQITNVCVRKDTMIYILQLVIMFVKIVIILVLPVLQIQTKHV